MNQTSIDESLERAIAWLDKMQTGGGYHRWCDPTTGERGPISSEITGYAAHLYSWLYALKPSYADKCRAEKACAWMLATFGRPTFNLGGGIPVEPGVPLYYFFDTGIVGRGLYAASRALKNSQYWDVAIAAAGVMTRFAVVEDPDIGHCGLYAPTLTSDYLPDPRPPLKWWSRLPGPYQRKAALLWKLCKAQERFDLLDIRVTHLDPAPREAAEDKRRSAGRKKAADQQGDSTGEASPVDNAMKDAPGMVRNADSDCLHPMAYSCEGLLMSEPSFYRALAEINLLVRAIEEGDDVRTDVLAQAGRIQKHAGSPSNAIGVDRIIARQHESGGFYFNDPRSSPNMLLSTHATIFAVQYLEMEHSRHRRTTPAEWLTGPLARRELAIV